MSTKRIYSIIESHENPPQQHFSNLEKLVENLGEEYDLPSYHALSKRLQRAKKRTGKAIIRLKSKTGTLLTIQVQDLQ